MRESAITEPYLLRPSQISWLILLHFRKKGIPSTDDPATQGCCRVFCAPPSCAKGGEVHVVERSRPFWNVRVIKAAGEWTSAVTGLVRTTLRSALSHGSLHVYDAFRENRPQDARLACGVSVRRCERTSSLPHTERSEPFAYGRCGLCLRVG